jgi:hypothetical protein
MCAWTTRGGLAVVAGLLAWGWGLSEAQAGPFRVRPGIAVSVTLTPGQVNALFPLPPDR